MLNLFIITIVICSTLLGYELYNLITEYKNKKGEDDKEETTERKIHFINAD